MKKRDLEKLLKQNGWRFLRSGANHDVFTNGKEIEQLPRHREINEQLAKAIIKGQGIEINPLSLDKIYIVQNRFERS